MYMAGQYDKQAIQYHINGYHLKLFLQEQNQKSHSVWNEVDFQVFGAHVCRLRPASQAMHMEVVHNQLPLGELRY